MISQSRCGPIAGRDLPLQLQRLVTASSSPGSGRALTGLRRLWRSTLDVWVGIPGKCSFVDDSAAFRWLDHVAVMNQRLAKAT